MIFETDMLIWVQRGNARAARWVDRADHRCISLQTYLELMEQTTSKQQHKRVPSFLSDFDFSILPLTEAIGYRAAVYIEEYSLGHGLRAGDAIVAATAVENHQVLVSGNVKHFRAIKELQLKAFRP